MPPARRSLGSENRRQSNHGQDRLVHARTKARASTEHPFIANRPEQPPTGWIAYRHFPPPCGNLTQLLHAMEQGDAHCAEDLLPLVYEELTASR